MVKEIILCNLVINSGWVLEEFEDWLYNLFGILVDILCFVGLVGLGCYLGCFFVGKIVFDGEYGVNLVYLEDVIGVIILLL